MITLDTDVVSEQTKPRSDPAVIAWLDKQQLETLYLTSTSLAELLTGIEILPQGKRRTHLESGLGALVDRLFGARILSYDQQAALVYGGLIARARKQGHAVHMADAQIAAIAAAHGFIVATRDETPFQAMGVAFVNPWGQERPSGGIQSL